MKMIFVPLNIFIFRLCEVNCKRGVNVRRMLNYLLVCSSFIPCEFVAFDVTESDWLDSSSTVPYIPLGTAFDLFFLKQTEPVRG